MCNFIGRCFSFVAPKTTTLSYPYALIYEDTQTYPSVKPKLQYYYPCPPQLPILTTLQIYTVIYHDQTRLAPSSRILRFTSLMLRY